MSSCVPLDSSDTKTDTVGMLWLQRLARLKDIESILPIAAEWLMNVLWVVCGAAEAVAEEDDQVDGKDERSADAVAADDDDDEWGKGAIVDGCSGCRFRWAADEADIELISARWANGS